MMSSGLYGTFRHCLYGTSPVRSSTDVIVTHLVTVTSQLFLHCARHCIGHKWPMDQMCSKHEKKNIVFNMTFRKYLNLGTLENFQTSENFQISFFWSKFIFFIEFFLTKMFFLTIFFQRIFYCFQDLYSVFK